MTGSSSLVCVTGRFQPVHADHLRLFARALADGDLLLVAVTNPDPGARRPVATSAHRHRADANPFTYFERLELLTAALAGERVDPARVRIVPFDLSRPEHWPGYVPLRAVQYVGVHGPWEHDKVRRLRAAGYGVVEVTGDGGERRSSSAVRAALRTGTGWEHLVPPATVPLLRNWLLGR